MFKDACSLSKYLELITENVLSLERTSKIWKVRETSITDLIIASFKAMPGGSCITVDASHEATTNADFEINFSKKWQRLNIAHPGKALRSNKERCGNTA